jgi:hypothetical protein
MEGAMLPSFFSEPVSRTVRVHDPSGWISVVTRARAHPVSKASAMTAPHTKMLRMALIVRAAKVVVMNFDG